MEGNLSIKILTWKTKFKEMKTELKILGNWFDLIFRDFGEITNDRNRKRRRNIKKVVTGDRFLRATMTRSFFVLFFFFLNFDFLRWVTDNMDGARKNHRQESSRHSVPYKLKLTLWSVIIESKDFVGNIEK